MRLPGAQSANRPSSISMLNHSENNDPMPSPTRFVRSRKAARGLVDGFAAQIVEERLKASENYVVCASISETSELRAPTRYVRNKMIGTA
jgi:hypothetical protein